MYDRKCALKKYTVILTLIFSVIHLHFIKDTSLGRYEKKRLFSTALKVIAASSQSNSVDKIQPLEACTVHIEKQQVTYLTHFM